MTLICKHMPSQGHFPTGLELSWSPANTSPRPSRCKSCIRALSNEITLKFSESTHHMKDQLSARCRRINLLGQAHTSNAAFIETLEHLNQMG